MFKFVRLLILPGIFLLSAAILSAQSSIARADQFYQMGAYTLANAQYKAYLEQNPNDQEALYKMLNGMSKLSQYDKIYQTLGLKDPSGYSTEILLLMGHTCKRLMKYDEAQMWYRSVSDSNDEVARHYYATCKFAKEAIESPALFVSHSLRLNTPHSDYGASVVANEIFFTSHRDDLLRIQKREEQKERIGSSQFYTAPIDRKGDVGEVAFLRDDMKDVFGESMLSFSEDQKYVAFVRSLTNLDGVSKIDAQDDGMSIYIAMTDGSTDWNLAQAFPYNSTSFSNAWPFLMNQGQTLYFASNRPGGYGGYDIYVSHRYNSKWSIPKNLGPKVNTPGNEISPVISNGSLYFASDWHPGLGGMDVFRAEIVRGEYQRIFHLGRDINSSWDDYELHLDPLTNIGYFTSNRPGGKGAEDIYACKKIAGQVSLLIRNAHDRTPIPHARISIEGAPALLTDAQGERTINLRDEDPINISIAADGYETQTKMVKADLKTLAVKHYMIKLSPKGSPVVASASVINSQDVIRKATQELAPRQNVSRPDPAHSKPPSQGLISSARTTPNGTPLHRPVRTSSTARVQSQSASVASPARQVVHNAQNYNNRVTVWAIQLASFHQTNSMNVDITPYKRLYNLGTIYKKEISGATKVRLGTFTEQLEAKQVLAKVKQSGFRDAFVVAESKILDIKAKPTPSKTTRPTIHTQSESGFLPLTEGYKIRLAALTDLSRFDATEWQKYATVEVQPKGRFMILHLSGFSTAQEALDLVKQVKKRAYPDAYVIVHTKGIISKIE